MMFRLYLCVHADDKAQKQSLLHDNKGMRVVAIECLILGHLSERTRLKIPQDRS
jgi:hypothetical protein